MARKIYNCDRCKNNYSIESGETEVRVSKRKDGTCKEMIHYYLCNDCATNLHLFLGNFEPDIK